MSKAVLEIAELKSDLHVLRSRIRELEQERDLPVSLMPTTPKAVKPRRMPKQKPGNSTQDYGTPRALLDALEARWGRLVFDLAATKDNVVCESQRWYGPDSRLGADSLVQDWTKLQGNLWLNPPFAHIAPWAEKCAASARWSSDGKCTRTIFLHVPAAVGSNWFADHVWGKCRVIALQGRVTYVGQIQPYPKDCLLCLYGTIPGFEVWKWRRP